MSSAAIDGISTHQGALGCQRSQFDIPEQVIWLDAAYMSPLSLATMAAGRGGVERRARPWELPSSEFFREVEVGRRQFAKLINADADDIAIVPAASYGIEIAARNLPVRRGEQIVVLADQFPSNFYAWQALCSRTGAELIRVPWADDFDWTAGILAALSERSRILTLPNCHWTDGTLVDLHRVALRCRELGAALVLDVTQSLGVLPLDIKKVQPDFLVCASYKWLLGPYSLGYLYAARHRQAGQPVENTPWAREAVNKLLDWRSGEMPYTESLMPNARRYDMGERANFTLLPMSVAALEQINGWQPARIQAYLQPLIDRAAERAQDLGLRVPPRELRAPHLIGLAMPEGSNAAELLMRLRAQGLYVSMRGGKLRVSPHVYNELSDIDKLFDGLGDLV